MPRSPWIECSFLIPVRRDRNLSDGFLHKKPAWRWLRRRLLEQFRGSTMAPDLYSSVYLDPDTGVPVTDLCRKFFVAMPRDRLDELRSVLRESCGVFAQKYIYLAAAGYVEFVEEKS